MLCTFKNEQKKDREKAPWKVIQVMKNTDIFPKSYSRTGGGKIQILLLLAIKHHINNSLSGNREQSVSYETQKGPLDGTNWYEVTSERVCTC